MSEATKTYKLRVKRTIYNGDNPAWTPGTILVVSSLPSDMRHFELVKDEEAPVVDMTKVELIVATPEPATPEPAAPAPAAPAPAAKK